MRRKEEGKRGRGLSRVAGSNFIVAAAVGSTAHAPAARRGHASDSADVPCAHPRARLRLKSARPPASVGVGVDRPGHGTGADADPDAAGPRHGPRRPGPSPHTHWAMTRMGKLGMMAGSGGQAGRWGRACGAGRGCGAGWRRSTTLATMGPAWMPTRMRTGPRPGSSSSTSVALAAGERAGAKPRMSAR